MHNNTPTSFDQIDVNNTNWCNNFDMVTSDKTLVNEIARLDRLDSNCWHRFFDNKNYPQLYSITNQNTLLCLAIDLNHTTKQLFVIGLSHFCYSDEFKQTLTVAAEQYSSIINKRITDVELSHNYSKLKKTLQALKSTQRKLSHNDKMASIGQLAAGVAHEINNPLSFISSNLNTLRDYIDLYEAELNLKENIEKNINTELEFARGDVYELLTSCTVGVDRVADIVNSLKSFSKKDENIFVILDIHDVIQESLKIVENKFKYHHEINQKIFGEPLIVKGNFGKLQQVFVNLFINAVQAMPESGILTIISSKFGNKAIIKVIDTGNGIAPKTLKKIFEPFYTTKSENDGTGLGLSVSYAIVINHHGQIKVTSEPNKGSEFTLTLPLYIEN
jgi:signal transduction histidine kinase